MCRELVDAERASEKAAAVVCRLQMNEPRIFQVRCLKSHEALIQFEFAYGPVPAKRIEDD